MGFRGKISRSTLADANESRDRRIYADFAQVLIGIARPLYADDPVGVELNENLYPILRALETADSEKELPDNANQLILFDF
jgi:hypothetical protein